MSTFWLALYSCLCLRRTWNPAINDQREASSDKGVIKRLCYHRAYRNQTMQTGGETSFGCAWDDAVTRVLLSPIGFLCLYFYAYACGSPCKLSLTVELSFYVVYIIRVHADRNWQTFIAFMVTTVTFTLWHTAATDTWLTTMANVASWKNKLILEQGLKNLTTNQCQKFMLKNCINLYSCRGELKKS